MSSEAGARKYSRDQDQDNRKRNFRGDNGHMRNNPRGGRARRGRPERYVNANVVIQDADADEFIENTKENTNDNNADNPFLAKNKSFEDIIDNQEVLNSVVQSFDAPSEIQAEVIPVLGGKEPKNMIVQSATGTGKTNTYLIPIMMLINKELQKTQAIVVAATHELVSTIYSSFLNLDYFHFYTAGIVLKGYDTPPPETQLLIGTPASIKALSKDLDGPNYQDGNIQTVFDLSAVKIVILDEADKTIGDQNSKLFQQILRYKVPKDARLGFFSATFSNMAVREIENLRPNTQFIKLLKERKEVNIKNIKHYFIEFPDDSDEQKLNVLIKIFKTNIIPKAFIFCNSKTKVDFIYDRMKKNNLSCSKDHSDLDPKERIEMFEQFRKEGEEGSTKYIVSTDVLSRGIDIPSATLVLNYDLPMTFAGDRNIDIATIYIHRSGRCGRFGKTGSCLSFVPKAKLNDIKFIAMKVNYELKQITVDKIEEKFNEKDITEVQDEKASNE